MAKRTPKRSVNRITSGGSGIAGPCTTPKPLKSSYSGLKGPTVALRALILLHVVQQHLQVAFHAP